MSRRFFPCTVMFLMSASLACAMPVRPNVVVIVADDLGYADTGYRGSRDMVTPHIDSIAQGGVQFSSGYVTAPVCGPSRAGLLSGIYQNRFGFEDNPGPYRLRKDVKIGIPKTVRTLPERMKALGYVTGMVGKSHTGDELEFHPNNSGFDEFFGFINGASNYRSDGQWGTKINQPGNPIYRGFDKVEEKEYLTDAFGREAVSFIDRHHAEPFFLYVPFNAIHGPQQGTEQDLDKFKAVTDKKRQLALAMTCALDRNVGRVLAAVRKHALEENTIVVFLSDNGGKPDDNGSLNTPLRGEKGQLWEGGIRVPFCMKWPARVKGGRMLDFPVIALDILPTVFAAAGGKLDGDMDGIDLMPFVTGESAPPKRTLHWRFNRSWAVRDGEWKLVFDGAGVPHLFRIVEDIAEAHDLRDQHPDVVQRLKAAHEGWNANLMPKLWGWDKSFPIYDGPK
jgi:arylsulfatase A-like enzyme